jgi:hypothetical protein
MLGCAEHAQGDDEAAHRCWLQALASLPETGTTPDIMEFRRLATG